MTEKFSSEILPEGAAFFCEDCDAAVFTIGFDPTPGIHACYLCRYIREHPDMPEEMKRRLRGDAIATPDTRPV